MKTLQEYLTESLMLEKYTDISDWSDEDKFLIARSFATERHLGYDLVEKDGKSGAKLMDVIEKDILKKFPELKEENRYLDAAHYVLDIIYFQIGEGASYQDACKLVREFIKSDDIYDTDEKSDHLKTFDMIVDADFGKNINGYKLHTPVQWSGFGSRKDFEKRLAKIKADSSLQRKYLGHGRI